jgi:SAM-dependent methyltransferase
MFTAPAEAYDRHVGRYGPTLARAFADLAGVRAGGSAIDVGCGPGPLTAELASRLGADRVAAVDPSPPFAEACRARVAGARVELAAAEQLPFPDGTFDYALSQLVVNFMTDAAAGVREMKRVTRPGGVVAAAVWDYAGEMTFLRRFWDAAVALDPAARERDEGVCMRYCTPDELRELWSTAGLEGAVVEPIVVSAGYENFEDLWAPLESGIGPSGAYVAELDDERRTALKDEFRRCTGVGSDPFTLSARAWTVAGRAE